MKPVNMVNIECNLGNNSHRVEHIDKRRVRVNIWIYHQELINKSNLNLVHAYISKHVKMGTRKNLTQNVILLLSKVSNF